MNDVASVHIVLFTLLSQPCPDGEIHATHMQKDELELARMGYTRDQVSFHDSFGLGLTFVVIRRREFGFL